MIIKRKFKCNQCNAMNFEEELLMIKIPHPSKVEEEVDQIQCPKCGYCNDFTATCDEPGCEKPVVCGWPSLDGYRQTCSEHSKTSST